MSHDHEVDVLIDETHEASPIIIRRENSSGSIGSAGGRRPGALRSFPSELSLTESQNVRYNVIREIRPATSTGSGGSGNGNGNGQSSGSEVRGSKLLVYVQTALQLPPALAAFVVVPMKWEEHCDKPLRAWAIFYAFALVASVAVSWIIYYEPTERIADMSRLRRFADSARKPLENFLLIWLIMGQVWVQSAAECEASAPGLFSLCFSLVVIGFCYFLLPCIIIILMLPFLCFCLPCVIRLLARFAGADHFAGKGATKDIIEGLPLKKYHPGLFEDEADPQCSICLSQYEQDQEVRLLPCDERHHFHKECVDEWLLVNASCPICRARIFEDEDSNHEEEPINPSPDNV